MTVLNQYQARRRASMLFLTASALIHVVLLTGISLVLSPDLVKQVVLPGVEVTLQDGTQGSSQSIANGQAVTNFAFEKTDADQPATFSIYTAKRVEPVILYQEDAADINTATLQVSADLIHKITAEIFAESDNRFDKSITQTELSLSTVSSYKDNTATEQVTTVVFNYTDGSRICSQFSEPDPLDSFDQAKWWITSTNCSVE